MPVTHYEEVGSQPVTMEGASGVTVRWLIGENDGAPNFAMRQFTLEPGGHTPRHIHPYEHEVFVIEGEGIIVENDIELPLRAGDVVFVKPDDVHQFRNTGSAPLKFLCLIPNSAAGQAVTVVPECGTGPS